VGVFLNVTVISFALRKAKFRIVPSCTTSITVDTNKSLFTADACMCVDMKECMICQMYMWYVFA